MKESDIDTLRDIATWINKSIKMLKEGRDTKTALEQLRHDAQDILRIVGSSE